VACTPLHAGVSFPCSYHCRNNNDPTRRNTVFRISLSVLVSLGGSIYINAFALNPPAMDDGVVLHVDIVFLCNSSHKYAKKFISRLAVMSDHCILVWNKGTLVTIGPNEDLRKQLQGPLTVCLDEGN
jgi:hypothetical protein